MVEMTPKQNLFQSTLSMRRATAGRPRRIHVAGISIHALHEESDELDSEVIPFLTVFQSTLSMRRATESIRYMPAGKYHFNPRSP